MDEESSPRTDEYGNVYWRYNNGYLHRLDGPAIEWNNGQKEWWQNGELHRLDGPARERKDGTKEWIQNGKWHRLDGPAIYNADGSKAWYQEGKLHRVDGPAREFAGGRKEWWLNDIPYKTKEEYFDALSDEAKAKCLFSEDFLNG